MRTHAHSHRFLVRTYLQLSMIEKVYNEILPSLLVSLFQSFATLSGKYNFHHTVKWEIHTETLHAPAMGTILVKLRVSGTEHCTYIRMYVPMHTCM